MLQSAVVRYELQGLVVQDVRDHVFQKLGVVGNADDGHVLQSGEVVRQPLDRVYVQVVRRFVKEEHLVRQKAKRWKEGRAGGGGEYYKVIRLQNRNMKTIIDFGSTPIVMAFLGKSTASEWKCTTAVF